LAVEQFWLKGYDKTTVATLTEAMGITAPSLYAAFGNKEQLFVEAAESYGSRTLEQVDAALSDPNATDGIAALMRSAAAQHTDPATPPGSFVLTERRLVARRKILCK